MSITPSIVALSALAIITAACSDRIDASPTGVPSMTRSSSPHSDASSTASTPIPSGADDFSDPSSGWNATGAARYEDGKLVVGNGTPAAVLVPSPVSVRGPAVVTARGSVRGQGVSVIGLFCAGRPDLSSAYVAFVDPARATATIGRFTTAGPAIMGEGKHVDEVASLAPPLSLTLTCTLERGSEEIRFAVDGVEVAIGADPAPLHGPVGGLYFETTSANTFGLFDDFSMTVATAPS